MIESIGFPAETLLPDQSTP